MAEKEYIEREKIISEICEVMSQIKQGPYKNFKEAFGTVCGLGFAVKKITTHPAADVAEVVHGKWIEHDQYVFTSDGEPVSKIGAIFICPYCGREEQKKEPYCNCGAKMDGKESNDAAQ